MKKIFEILIFSLMAISCSTGNKEGTKINDVTVDTLITKGNEVVFFKPSKNEFQLLIDKFGKESGIYQVDSAFNKYMDSISVTFKDWKKIKCQDHRIIRIIAFDGTSSYLDRMNNGTNYYGIIFNNEKFEPVVEFGIVKNENIIEMMKRLKNK